MNTHSSIERLESRIAPAGLLVKLSGGTLNISGDALNDAVHIDLSGGSIEVLDGAVSLGIFAGVKTITAKLLGPTSVDVDLPGGGLTGALSVSLAGVGSLSLAAGSSVGGALSFTGDSSAQTLSLGSNVALGKTLTFAGGLGADAFTIGAGTTIGGNATFTSIETGLFADSTVIAINGNLVFKNAASTLDVDLHTNFNQGLQVTGKTSYAGGSGADSLGFGGTFGGSVTFSDKSGNNSLFFGSASVIRGSVVMITGSGNDSIGIQLATVDKDVTLKLGAGTNSFLYGGAGAVNIGGSALFTGGAGDDSWRSLGGVMTVGKNFTAQLGDGTNVVNVATVVNGSKVLVSTGSGVDTVALVGSAASAALVVSLGAGADDFASTLTGVLSARYDGGTGLDRFRPNTLTGDPVTVKGFEDFS